MHGADKTLYKTGKKSRKYVNFRINRVYDLYAKSQTLNKQFFFFFFIDRNQHRRACKEKWAQKRKWGADEVDSLTTC